MLVKELSEIQVVNRLGFWIFCVSKIEWQRFPCISFFPISTFFLYEMFLSSCHGKFEWKIVPVTQVISRFWRCIRNLRCYKMMDSTVTLCYLTFRNLSLYYSCNCNSKLKFKINRWFRLNSNTTSYAIIKMTKKKEFLSLNYKTIFVSLKIVTLFVNFTWIFYFIFVLLL